MANSTLQLTLCGFLLTCSHSSALAQAEPPCSEPPREKPSVQARLKIERVEFSGESKLLNSVRDELTRMLEGERGADPGWLEEVESLLRDVWQDQGYFTFQTRVESQRLDKGDQLQRYAISIHIEEGQQFRLWDIEVHEADESRPLHFSSIALRDLFHLRAGDVFSVKKIRDGIDRIRRRYVRAGYLDAVAEPATEVDPTRRTIFLRIQMNEGKQFRVSRVDVFGDKRLEALVKSHARIGEVFDFWALHDAIDGARGSLPAGFNSEQISVVRNVEEGTVALYIDVRPCGHRSGDIKNVTINTDERPTLRKLKDSSSEISTETRAD